MRAARATAIGASPFPSDAALRHHDFLQRVPAVPGAADHGQADPAVVRRIGQRMDDLPGVFPARAAARATPTRIWSCGGFRPARSCGCTSTLLALSCLMLPIIPGAHWKPLGGESPCALILGLLALTIGLPYFLLSTTSPLVQSWFARRFPGRSPYRLFALSNLASMLALVGYPFALEPWVTTRMQSYGWSAGYLVFVLLCGACAWYSLRTPPPSDAMAPDARGTRASDGRRHGGATGSLGGARRDGIVPAARRLQSHLREHLVDPAVVDRTAVDLPADVHSVLRQLALVPARPVRRDACGSAGRHGVDARQSRPDAQARAADRRLLHRPFRRLHVLPRRACAPQAAAALSDALLPDGFGRRRARIGAGGHRCAADAACVLRAFGRPGRLRRCCSHCRCAASIRCSSMLAVAAVLFTLGTAGWGIREFYDGTILATRNFYGVLARAGRRRRRGSPPLARPRHDPARQPVSRAGSRAPSDDLLHADLGRRPRARIDASDDAASEGRRDRPRHGHDRGLRQQRRRLPLLRHQSGGDPHRQQRVHLSQGQRGDDRDRRSATPGSVSSESRRRISTCSRSTPSRAIRSLFTFSRRKRWRSIAGT